MSPLELAETQLKTAAAYGAEVIEGVAEVGVATDDRSVFEVRVAWTVVFLRWYSVNFILTPVNVNVNVFWFVAI